jgi:hypothetical protein
MLALVLSIAMPQISITCHQSRGRQMCHRAGAVHQHNCGMMMPAGEAAGSEDAGTKVSASDVSSKCPMNCCFRVNSGSNAAIVAAHHFGRQLPAKSPHQPASAIFASNGFSSHTDRGPPPISIAV